MFLVYLLFANFVFFSVENYFFRNVLVHMTIVIFMSLYDMYLGVTSGNSDAGSNTAKRRRRRSISSDNTTIDANATTPATDYNFNPQQANFSVIVVTTGCRKWDEAQQAWISDGCQVYSYEIYARVCV